MPDFPFLSVVYVTAYVDRSNAGFAGLSMTRELHFSNEVFCFGAGIFFFCYCLLQSCSFPRFTRAPR